jgi:hypothetical protein
VIQQDAGVPTDDALPESTTPPLIGDPADAADLRDADDPADIGDPETRGASAPVIDPEPDYDRYEQL